MCVNDGLQTRSEAVAHASRRTGHTRPTKYFNKLKVLGTMSHTRTRIADCTIHSIMANMYEIPVTILSPWILNIVLSGHMLS